MDEIKKEYPKIQTAMVVADFSELNSIKDYKEKITSNLEKYDIGLLALNAGVGTMGPFDQLYEEEVERIVNVNALHVIYMSKLMVHQFLKRYDTKGVKSAIVVTSSGLGAIPVSGTITYSATKSFASFVAEGLNYELKGKVDVMSYQAGEVTTKMLNRFKTDSRTKVQTSTAPVQNKKELPKPAV